MRYARRSNSRAVRRDATRRDVAFASREIRAVATALRKLLAVRVRCTPPTAHRLPVRFHGGELNERTNANVSRGHSAGVDGDGDGDAARPFFHPEESRVELVSAHSGSHRRYRGARERERLFNNNRLAAVNAELRSAFVFSRKRKERLREREFRTCVPTRFEISPRIARDASATLAERRINNRDDVDHFSRVTSKLRRFVESRQRPIKSVFKRVLLYQTIIERRQHTSDIFYN